MFLREGEPPSSPIPRCVVRGQAKLKPMQVLYRGTNGRLGHVTPTRLVGEKCTRQSITMMMAAKSIRPMPHRWEVHEVKCRQSRINDSGASERPPGPAGTDQYKRPR